MASIGHRSISTLSARLTHQKNVVQIDILEYDQIFDQSREQAVDVQLMPEVSGIGRIAGRNVHSLFGPVESLPR